PHRVRRRRRAAPCPDNPGEGSNESRGAGIPADRTWARLTRSAPSGDRCDKSKVGQRGQTGRPDYEIVVSAENNAYLLWQCLLFHAACMDVQGFAPTFVVHALGPLLSGFRVLEQHGARVIAAPNY